MSLVFMAFSPGVANSDDRSKTIRSLRDGLESRLAVKPRLFEICGINEVRDLTFLF